MCTRTCHFTAARTFPKGGDRDDRKERDRDGNKLSFAVPIKTVSQALPKWWVGTTKVPFPPIGGYGG